MRQLTREAHPNCDEIVRRYGADKKDFVASRIKEINPDIIHLHNLHEGYINLRMLFKYLKEVTYTTINKKRSRNVTCDFGPLRKWTNKEKLY